MNMPGFSAAVVLESGLTRERYTGGFRRSLSKSKVLPPPPIQCGVNKKFWDCAKLVAVCDAHGGGMSSTGDGRYACDL